MLRDFSDLSNPSTSQSPLPFNLNDTSTNSLNDDIIHLNNNCAKVLVRVLKTVSNQLTNEHKHSQAHLYEADLYTVSILGLFATIIILLMFRSIKPNESMDDQVLIMLSSMQMRIDMEESERSRKKLRDAKRRAQDWLVEIRRRGFNNLNKKINRSASVNMHCRREPSISSVPDTISPIFFSKKPPRARSFQGRLPEIILIDEKQQQQCLVTNLAKAAETGKSASRQSISRQSSGTSCASDCFSPLSEAYFRFPEVEVESAPESRRDSEVPTIELP